MQATCERCGKTITPEDFRAGRYFLFWITPTIPSEGLYLCEACRGISWDEREALFHAWMERHGSGPARRVRPARTKRASRKRVQAKPDEPSPKSPSPTPEARITKKRAAKKSVSDGLEVVSRADRGETPWWEDPVRKHEKFQELAQMAFSLFR